MSARGERQRLPTISRVVLESMHAAVKNMLPRVGSEAFSVMAALGACLGQWPHVRRSKANELRRRFALLTGGAKPVPPPEPVQQQPPKEVEAVPADVRQAIAGFVALDKNLPDECPVLVVPGGKPTGLTLGQLRRAAEGG